MLGRHLMEGNEGMSMMNRRRTMFHWIFGLVSSLLVVSGFHGTAHAAAAAGAGAGVPVEHIVIDARAAGRPFPHFWDHMFGSGRAVLVLRANYQRDLTMMKGATGIRFVRFHGLLDRGVGLTGRHTAAFYNKYSAGAHRPATGSPYNFSYVDQIMDALLAHGVRPYIELDFMPPALARNPKMVQSFWYHPVVSPPRSYAQWDDMSKALARNFIAQYGINEVAKWYCEVWNEPNLSFWGGVPKQSTYFTLYDHTARALKSVSKRLRVGGPATAQAAWVPAFLRHVAKDHVPIDFVSTHVYGNDTAMNVFGRNQKVSRRTMVCRAVRKVHDEIARSRYPHLPLVLSEFNASYSNEPDVTDTPYMGPWLDVLGCVRGARRGPQAVLRRFRPDRRRQHSQAGVRCVCAAASLGPCAYDAGNQIGADHPPARRFAGLGAVGLLAAGRHGTEVHAAAGAPVIPCICDLRARLSAARTRILVAG